MERVVVVGSSGSGKTTLARTIAERLDLPHLEMDSVAHRGGFGATPGPQFRTEVAAFTRHPRWIVDGNYTSWGATESAWPKADTFVWVDPPKRTVMSRVVRRTLRRVITREVLWDGVREPWTNLYKRNPDENIIVWAWTRFDHIRAKYESAIATGSWDHAAVYRLQTTTEMSAFLERLESPPL